MLDPSFRSFPPKCLISQTLPLFSLISITYCAHMQFLKTHLIRKFGLRFDLLPP